MNLNKQEKRYKEWIAIGKEWDEIREKLRKLPLVELKEPYQNGWILTFDFREDVKNRKDYPILKRVLDLINIETFIKDVNYLKYVRQNRAYTSSPYRKGKSYYWPHPRVVYPREFEKLDDKLKEQFFKSTIGYMRHECYRHKFPNYYLVIKDKPNIITHAYQSGGELESREQYLRDKWIEYSYEFATRGGSSSYPAYKDRTIVRDKISKFLKGEIEDITNEKIPKEYDW